MNESKEIRTAAMCTLRYRKATQAVQWLCDVFGFKRHAVYEGPNDTIAHGELVLGDSMIMIGSLTEDAFGELTKQPDEIGGKVTQSVYLVIADTDEVYQRAKKAGAEIVMEIEDKDYGGRGFSCRDPEGHIWSVGSYDPWQKK